MALIFGSFLAKDTSTGPPHIKTKIVGPLEAMATLEINSCWWPGKRTDLLSRALASMDWSRPITNIVASAWVAADIAAPNCWLLLQATFMHPASCIVFVYLDMPCNGDVYPHATPKITSTTMFLFHNFIKFL